MSFICSICKDVCHGRWKLYMQDGHEAYICMSCQKWLWRDHTKLEEYMDNHHRNKEFPAFVIDEMLKRHSKSTYGH